jgi:hypothetical protein
MKKNIPFLSVILLLFLLSSAKNNPIKTEVSFDKGKFPELKVEVYNNGKKVSFARKKLFDIASDTSSGWVKENISVQDLGKIEVKVLNEEAIRQSIRQEVKLSINHLDMMLVRGEQLIGNPQSFANYRDASQFSLAEWLKNRPHSPKDRLVIALNYSYKVENNPALGEQKSYVVNFELK